MAPVAASLHAAPQRQAMMAPRGVSGLPPRAAPAAASALASRHTLLRKPQSSHTGRATTTFSTGMPEPNTSPAPRAVRASVVADKVAGIAPVPTAEAPSQPKTSADGDAVPSIFKRNAERFHDKTALLDPHKEKGIKVTYGELWSSMTQLAAGLRSMGLEAGECVSLFSENSSRWIVADQAVHLCGCADAVRGSSAPLDEMDYIMSHSRSSGLVVQDKDALKKVAPALVREGAASLRFVVVLWGSRADVDAVSESSGLKAAGVKLVTYDEALAAGGAQLSGGAAFEPAVVGRSDMATLVYTSGTTGHPKAVTLTHGNLLYQIENLGTFLPVCADDSALSLLPPWHIYERATSYYILSTGATQVYSNIRRFKDDLSKYKPDYFVCVPLVLDTLHSKVMANLRSKPEVARNVAMTLINASQAYVRARRTANGLDVRFARSPVPLLETVMATLLSLLLAPLHALAQRLVFAKVREAVGIRYNVISGGGALAPHLDDFYEAMGLEVLNGWGLSETSPVLACRVSSRMRQDARPNTRGSIGFEIPGTQVRVVDVDTLRDVPDGTPGLLLARGPGVMQGYLADEASTAKAFRAGDGWFDTGDLGWRAPQGVAGSKMAGCIVLTGRAKDTIVMASGKNVEPEPIESAIQCSGLVKHAILLGQDKRELGALVFPDEDAVESLAATRGGGAPPSDAELHGMLLAEVARLNQARVDYQSFEHISRVALARTPLSVEDGTLTRTMKPRRPEIFKAYKPQIDALLAQLRG